METTPRPPPPPLPPVPVEVLEQILMYLSIDCVVHVALASKELLAPLLLASHAFAKRHFDFQDDRRRIFDLTRHYDPSWPLKYRVVTYQIALTSNDECLEKGLNFVDPASDPDSVRLLTSLITEYPGFFLLNNHWHRILEQALLTNDDDLLQMLLKDPRLGFKSTQLLILDWYYSWRGLVVYRLIQTPQDIVLQPKLRQKSCVNSAWISLIQDPRVVIANSSLSIACYDEYHDELLPWGFDFWDAMLKNPNTEPGTYAIDTLNAACRKGDVHVVKILLGTGYVDPSFDIKKALGPHWKRF
ncbi:hypothetical protein BDR26DRAFT_853593 [Obelidium mucronatum]|nr:hypothetical protein BDR26DRAFT_853593 [Obelidium mucronatum]